MIQVFDFYLYLCAVNKCYNRLVDNVKGGLGWHIKDAWSIIDKYRDGMAVMGLSREFIPATPEEQYGEDAA